jgi:hypothetical protein
LADDFQSINVKGTKGKAQLIEQVEGFGKLLPNIEMGNQEYGTRRKFE